MDLPYEAFYVDDDYDPHSPKFNLQIAVMHHSDSDNNPADTSVPPSQHRYPEDVSQSDRKMDIQNSDGSNSPISQSSAQNSEKATPISTIAQRLPEMEYSFQPLARNIYSVQTEPPSLEPPTFSPPRTNRPFNLGSRSPLGTLAFFGNLDTPSPPRRAEHLINRRTRFEREMDNLCAEAENSQRERSQSKSKKASALEGVDNDDKYVGPWVLGRVVGKGASGRLLSIPSLLQLAFLTKVQQAESDWRDQDGLESMLRSRLYPVRTSAIRKMTPWRPRSEKIWNEKSAL